MRLIIAEKPSQARSIAKALGIRGKSTEGAIEGDNATVTWCIGHLVCLAMPEDYDPKYKHWNADDLPIIPDQTMLIPGKNASKQWKIVKSLLNSKKYSEVINATDSGREGELIFDNVYRLSGSRIPIKRLWTASLTDDAIRLAFKELKPSSQFNGLRDAARCRSEADWIVGINATRLETLIARSYGMLDGVYPVGRVQTPTLAMIVSRESEIENFKPQDYWTLSVLFDQSGIQYAGTWFLADNSRFNCVHLANEIADKVRSRSGSIAKFDKKEERIKAPLLYDLTTLQREANTKLGLTAENTLNICQSLYENHKALSYPRTNSRYLSQAEANDLPKIIDSLMFIEPYKPLIESKHLKTLPSRFVNEKKIEDHHAIIPTGVLPSKNLNNDEKRIFDLVFRRTLAAFYNDRVDLVTRIVTIVENETFRTNGRIMRETGWWAINPSSEKKVENALPNIADDKPVIAKDTTVKKGTTTPPPRYSEASLLKGMETAGKDIKDDELKEAMKEGGLGTPATRASIIEGLKSRGLILAKGKSLEPTAKGKQLIKQIPDGPLKSPIMTGEWEKKLSQMVRGEYSRSIFMSEIIELTRNLVNSRIENAKTASNLTHKVGSCPKCESSLLLNTFKNKYFVKCLNSECGLSFSSDSNGNPEGGYCNQDNCNGPVTITRNGSSICVLCNTWQNPIIQTPLGDCLICKSGQLHLKCFRGRYYAKCSNCNLAYDTDSTGQPKGGVCIKCRGPVKITKNKSKICSICGEWQTSSKKKFFKRKKRNP